MSTKKQSAPFAKLKTAVDHYADFRDERDVALKTAAAALATLEATMDSDPATQADIDAAFAEQDTTVSAAWSSSWRKATLRFCPRPTRRTWPRRDAQRERSSRLKNPLADLFLWVAHRPSVIGANAGSRERAFRRYR